MAVGGTLCNSRCSTSWTQSRRACANDYSRSMTLMTCLCAAAAAAKLELGVPPNCNCSSPPRNKQGPGAPPSWGRRCFFHPQLRSFAVLVVPDDTAILRERGCCLRVTKFGHSHKKPCFRPQSAMIIKRVCRPWVTARKAVLPRFDVVSPLGVVLRALPSCSSKHREEVLEAAFSFMTFSPAAESMVSSRNWSTDTELIWASFCLSQPR